MEYETLEGILQILLICMKRHTDKGTNKGWFIKLIQNSLEGKIDTELDADLIYNATAIESILANLLSINIKIIVKIRLVYRVICTL